MRTTSGQPVGRVHADIDRDRCFTGVEAASSRVVDRVPEQRPGHGSHFTTGGLSPSIATASSANSLTEWLSVWWRPQRRSRIRREPRCRGNYLHQKIGLLMDAEIPDGFVDLRGVRFLAITEDGATTLVLESWSRGEGGWVSTPNTHQLHLLARHAELRRLTESARLTLADGMPLVWASRLQRTPLPERVAGSNLVWSLAAKARERDAPLFLLGGAAGVAERAADVMTQRLPGLRITGTCCPPVGFERSEAEMKTIRDRLREAQPAIVYVGLGFPKQERLIVELLDDLPGTWFLGIGVSLSFISGDIARAPGWIQRLGLEWAFRLSQEPSRLFKRYIVDGIPFTVGLLATSLIGGLKRWPRFG
jgi:N-acetylglucosaminyldiphosphoundecaprenol N-acetyl-beta-D-mannosaminyltransferase